MTKEEILHLSRLARIKLSDDEVAQLNTEIDAILGYVSQIDDVVSSGDLAKKVGPVHNVWREDEVTNVPGSFTEAIMAEMPATEGTFLKVKKILNTDD